MISASEFEKYFRTYYNQLYMLANNMLCDVEESSDVVQEVFAQLWEKQPRIEDGKIQNYLLRSTYNCCLNRIKHEKKFEALRDSYVKELKFIMQGDGFDWEIWNKIQLFIQTEIPPRTREALDLCFGEGLSYKEAAERMKVTTDAINKHIVTGLRLLRKRFKNK